MKMFIVIFLILVVIISGLYYLRYNQNLYVYTSTTGDLSVPFKSEGKEIKYQNSYGNYQPMIIKGVGLLLSKPGHYSQTSYPQEEDYLRWFEHIGAMGANTIRAAMIMNNDFYNALYNYNATHDSPLYLIQGIAVEDVANYGDGDAYDDNFLGKLIEDGLNAVDIIHGRKIVTTRSDTGIAGIERYNYNISPWVIGFLVGMEWDRDIVAYTDNRTIYSNSYNGSYFSTREEATRFEAMLAQVMDKIVDYETNKYNSQRLIGFINDPEIDFLIYERTYARQLGKYSYIDAEHIVSTNALESGQFAAYSLYEFAKDFSSYLSEEEKNELSPLLEDLDTTTYLNGYLGFLSRYHTMPLIVADYGFSTSRGITEPEDKPLTEYEQGISLVEVYKDALKEGWSGVFISTWQDDWGRRSWNTAYATNYENTSLWHNLQNVGQGYGLMSVSPGEIEPVTSIDGIPNEWAPNDKVFENEGLILSARYDYLGLYLLVQGKDINPEYRLFLPIDTTQKSGSNIFTDFALGFDRAADFIIDLNGESNTRLLVQERYDSVRANFGQQIYGSDPYINHPDTNDADFVTSYMVIDNNNLIDDIYSLTPERRRELTALGTWETGLLTHGVGDPNSEDYNSLADFYYGENCVEIRIPWHLLNIGDPTDMLMHNDYYQHYGVEFDKISSLYLGITDGDGIAQMKPFKVNGLGNPIYHERLKKSYYIVQDEWHGGNTYGNTSY